MTLLVLDIRLNPGLDAQHLARGLYELIPRLYSYVISFFVLALFWWIYHRIVALFAECDDGLVWLNVGFLFAVTLAPFTAHLLGAFYGTRLATELYCLNLTVLSVLLNVLWRHAENYGLVDPGVDADRRRSVRVRLRATIILYLITMTIGFWFPAWFWLGFALTVPVRWISGLLVRA